MARIDWMAAKDADLLVAVRAGDQAAFAELWGRHNAALLHYATRLNASEAEDLVALCWLSVYEFLRRHDGDDIASVAPYLRRCCQNANKSLLRSKMRRSIKVEIEKQSIPDGSPLASARLEALEIIERVNDELNRGSESRRRLFVETQFNGEDTKEVAAKHGLTAETVRSSICRTRKTLEFILEEDCNE